MHDFIYRGNELWCEGVSVKQIAQEIGTPFYLYSLKTLRNHYRVFDKAFTKLPHITCFSVKANSNISILKIFAREGGGVDIVSGGELYRALQAGIDPAKIVYSGVGKRVDEIEYALNTDILLFNIESSEEIRVIDECAGRLGRKARIAIRINPDVNPKTHPHISTGLKENKFGINIERALQEYRFANNLKNIEVVGADCHIGSQVTQVAPFIEALERLKKLIGLLEDQGIRVRYLDLGGGLGITYNQELPPHPEEYARAVIGVAGGLDLTFIFEPGRVIVGNAGIMVTKVLYRKSNEGKNFVVVDAGMNDLIRPSLYNSFHAVQPVIKKEREEYVADIVGPICESGDYFARSRSIPKMEQGELVAIMSAGAYGFSMSSNYNSRPRSAEVLVNGGSYCVIKKRESCEDLLRGEEIPDYLK
jgi:diaminopimelate decarboxylase